MTNKILAPMLHARETGEGQLVDVALVDSIVLLCEIAVYRYCYRRGHWAAGNSHPHLVPFDNYPTKDGACAIVALTDNHCRTASPLKDDKGLPIFSRTVCGRCIIHDTLSRVAEQIRKLQEQAGLHYLLCALLGHMVRSKLSLQDSGPPGYTVINQCLLIDGDDTLWENNVYFERAIEEFIDLVIHEHLTRADIRRILDQIELANCRLHGYGARSFVRSMHDCYRQVHSEEIPTDKAQVITGLGKRILGSVPELISGVQETLLYLRPRHRLILLTKGNFEEQSTKVERSGLRPLFEDVIIVSEKTVDTYTSVAEQAQVDIGRTWMIGNSPKSDIVPALAAGFRAVLVPHAQTWQLEQQEVPQAPEHLLLVDRFADLMTHF